MNILKIVAVIAVVVAVAFAAIHIMGMFEQTKPIAEAATGMAGQAKDYVTSNIPTIVAGAGAVTGIAGGALSKIQTAKKQATDIKAQADTHIAQLTEEKNKLTDSTKTQITELTTIKDDALTQKNDLQKELDITKQQLETSLSQNSALQKLNSGTITDLWKNSGGEFWTDPITGEKYKLMNFEKIVVK